MDRRAFLSQSGFLAWLTLQSRSGLAIPAHTAPHGILGMYVHEGWPYKHPYAARTWSLEDWRGYADGMGRLGYNTFVIWPALEIMADPPTPEDRAQIANTAAVLHMLHREFGFTVFLTLCPNFVARPASRKISFSRRPLFSSLQWVDPEDTQAMKRMLRQREELLKPLAEMDGIAMIDSDPGGYPGSDNRHFASLIEEHRKLLNRLRPGIELYYWMHVGWQAYCDFYATGTFRWGRPEESDDLVAKLKKLNPAPWGITIHTSDPPPNGTDINLARKFGLASSALAFNYGAIEGEPSYPLTNFGGDAAFKAGAAAAPHGVVGNAQTHCLQIPNTFAFARGAQGKPVSLDDYEGLAGDLIAGQGKAILRAWRALAGSHAESISAAIPALDGLLKKQLVPGPLRGLLFGSPRRFVSDLRYQLRMKAAFLQFMAASREQFDHAKFHAFLNQTDAWEAEHGYQAPWTGIWESGSWAGLAGELKKLHSARINSILDETAWMNAPAPWKVGVKQSDAGTPFLRIQDLMGKWDSNTTRLIQAMKAASRRSS